MTLKISGVYVGLNHFSKNRAKVIYVDAKGILTKRNNKSAVLTDFE